MKALFFHVIFIFLCMLHVNCASFDKQLIMQKFINVCFTKSGVKILIFKDNFKICIHYTFE